MGPMPQPAPGAISFQYLAEIAIGATARVDLCRATGPGREGQLLAVKRLHSHIAQDPAFANMFLDEVWMTAALKHPNVVEVAGWGTDSQGTYLAVELVQGVSLARLMKTVFDTGEVFSERMVVFVASQLCAGLVAAHGLRSADGEILNLVHRDLTPGNVLVSFAGDVKIADFGLAKAKQRVTKTLTGLLKGRPQYMAPEQARGQDIDGRADLFSLGVLLFELFAGRRPWSATSELQIMHVTANEPPLDLRECRPKIDKGLVAIVMGCLEKDPAARFSTAEEVVERLEEWLRAHGYMDGNEEALGRFIRRNAMRQMRWFERAVSGDLAPMPDSMRPRTSGAVRSPVVRSPDPTRTNDPRRARVKPRRPIDSETTEVTDAESKVAALQLDPGLPRIVEVKETTNETVRPAALKPPALADLPLAPGEATPSGIDWGEEVPTLVQLAQQGASKSSAQERARVKPRVPAGRPMFESRGIFDEDSDQRATNVHDPRDSASDSISDLVSTRERQAAQLIDDPESEEVPTLPLQSMSQRTQVPPTPNVPRMPMRPGDRGRAPLPLAPPAAGSKPPERLGTVNIPPPPLSPTMKPHAPSSGVPPMPMSPPHAPSGGMATPLPPSPSPRGAGLSAPPMAGVATLPPPPSPRDSALASGFPPPSRLDQSSPLSGVRANEALSQDVLQAEAERLLTEAARASDEAKRAAAHAVRRAMMAKLMGEAAEIAAEAFRMSATSGLGAAIRRLEEARSIEQAVQRGELGPSEVLHSRAPPTLGVGTSALLRAAAAPPADPSSQNGHRAPSTAPPSYAGGQVSSSSHPVAPAPPSPSPAAMVPLPTPNPGGWVPASEPRSGRVPAAWVPSAARRETPAPMEVAPSPRSPPSAPSPPQSPAAMPVTLHLAAPGAMTPQGTVRLQSDRGPLPTTEPLFNLAAAKQQSGSSAFDDVAFKNRLQPTLLGMPVPVAILFITGGFLIIALVTWILLR